MLFLSPPPPPVLGLWLYIFFSVLYCCWLSLFSWKTLMCHSSTSESIYNQRGPWTLPLLPLPSECWNCRHMPPYPVSALLGTEPRASSMLGKQCTNQASGPALLFCADSATNQQTRTHCQRGQIQACSLLAGLVQGVMKKGSRWGFLCLRTGGMVTWRSPHQHA